MKIITDGLSDKRSWAGFRLRCPVAWFHRICHTTDFKREADPRIADPDHYVCVTVLTLVVTKLAESWATKTSGVVGALLSGHLSVCGGENTGSTSLQMMQKDVFFKIEFHYVVITQAGGRLDGGVLTIKPIFDFQYSWKLHDSGTPSERLASAANYVSIFGRCTPTQQVSTSSHGERHA